MCIITITDRADIKRQTNMAYQWSDADRTRFDEAIEKMDFAGLDKDEVVTNSLLNSADVAEEDDPVGCAIGTAEMYIDQGVSSF